MMSKLALQILLQADGTLQFVYDELVDLSSLGPSSIKRASNVEADANGRWHADLRLVAGPVLGPFPVRSQALAAERAWLSAKLVGEQ